MPWRRAWQPTLVFLPGESHGQRSLASCSPWGCKESDMTEQLNTATFLNLSETPAAKQCCHRIGFLNVSTLPPSVGEGFIPCWLLHGYKTAATTPAFMSTFKPGKRGKRRLKRLFSFCCLPSRNWKLFRSASRLHLTSYWPE